MEHLFYSTSFFFILYELFVVQNTERVKRFIDSLKLKSKQKFDFDGKDIFFTFFQLSYLVWVFIGLFSSEWQLFIILLIVGLVPKNGIWIRRIDSIISMVLLVTIIISNYHYQVKLF